METTSNPLQDFKQRAIWAHNWTSFSPEKRGEQMIQDYGTELTADIEELKSKGIDDANIEDYTQRYKRFFSSWIGAKSNCFSTMITGGSGVNVRKHEKANRSEQRHYEIFREWRERAKKAIIRKSLPAKTFSSEVERYRADLDKMQRTQEIMKNCNAIIRKSKGKDCTELLKAAGLSEKNAIEIQKPDFANRIGFASYSLTNNNANIKRVEQRIKELEAKEEKATTTGSESLQYNTFELIYNYEIDRMQIKHASKPSSEVISLLKHHGFKWSPSQGVWQRQITANAKWTLKHSLLPKLIELDK